MKISSWKFIRADLNPKSYKLFQNLNLNWPYSGLWQPSYYPAQIVLVVFFLGNLWIKKVLAWWLQDCPWGQKSQILWEERTSGTLFLCCQTPFKGRHLSCDAAINVYRAFGRPQANLRHLTSSGEFFNRVPSPGPQKMDQIGSSRLSCLIYFVTKTITDPYWP